MGPLDPLDGRNLGGCSTCGLAAVASRSEDLAWGQSLSPRHSGQEQLHTPRLRCWTPLVDADWRHRMTLRSVDCKKVDCEPNRSEQHDMMRHIGGYCLLRIRVQYDIDDRFSEKREPQFALLNSEQTPGARAHSMRAEEGGGDRLFSPFRTGANESELVRHFATIARRAGEGGAYSFGASVILQDPCSDLEWRAVTDVLVVPTRELGNPITSFIEMESCDRSVHG